jgi:hypothetical protein
MNPPIEPIEPIKVTRRPFRIGDIMMLVVVAAVMAPVRHQYYWMLRNTFLLYNDYEGTRHCIILALTNASAIWLASILLRPADRRRMRRGAPGLIVHLAVAIVIGLGFVEWLGTGLAFQGIWAQPFGMSLRRCLCSILLGGLATSVSIAIAASWVTLVVVGRWRPEPSWDDRIGRLLAVAWLILGPLDPLVRAWKYR